MRVSHVRVPLSKLHAGNANPRRVKPTLESQQQLIASIRAFGLVQPLVVRPMPGTTDEYRIIAGNRRLAALRQIHRRDADEPRIRCEVRDVDDATAEAIALAENVIREQMHPLDEAEAYTRLAAEEAQGVDAIASAFGVTERYVRQRMRLAGLARAVKDALRGGEIDLATAAAFAAVPQDRQMAVWEELNGHPRHAEHVRNIIEHGWIDASHALFDLSVLPESAVSRDLFSERVLVERDAFMSAQTAALDIERTAQLEAGWREVVTGRYEDIREQPLSMDSAERELDPKVIRTLQKLADRREKWEAKLEALPEGDETAINAIQQRLEALEAQEREVEQAAPRSYSDATKSVATAFLILYPDGQVRREFRVPRAKSGRSSTQTNGSVVAGGAGRDDSRTPTSDDLNDRQLADAFTHQTLAVREALLKGPAGVRKRVLALILHDKVRGEALAVRHDANAVTLHASSGESFSSAVFQRLEEKRASLDPFDQAHYVDEADAYGKLVEMSEKELGQLIDVLIVACLSSHLQRSTGLVRALSIVLGVELRRSWRPDAKWLANYQKVQLGHLLAELHGRTYQPANESRKKSELVDALTKLFVDAADGKLEDASVSARANAWLPATICSPPSDGDVRQSMPTACGSDETVPQ